VERAHDVDKAVIAALCSALKGAVAARSDEAAALLRGLSNVAMVCQRRPEAVRATCGATLRAGVGGFVATLREILVGAAMTSALSPLVLKNGLRLLLSLATCGADTEGRLTFPYIYSSAIVDEVLDDDAIVVMAALALSEALEIRNYAAAIVTPSLRFTLSSNSLVVNLVKSSRGKAQLWAGAPLCS
jgi:hypothetical protein